MEEINNKEDEFYRTRLLFGSVAFEKLQKSKVIIFGLGGVGGYAFEALIRTGVKNLDIVDFDRVNITNINRQIIANHTTIGEFKADLLKKRGLEINPEANINTFKTFFSN